MIIRTLLLASTAALSMTAGARAADAIVAAEPEAMEYVRVCDAFGEGFFYIPGTETCLKIGGYVRNDNNLGESAYSGEDLDWSPFTRGTLTLDARNDTEFGELRSFIEMRSEASDGESTTYINSAYIMLGGFMAGFNDSRYDLFLNSAGNIINDDVIDYTGDRTNQVSYQWGGDKGFSAFIGVEEGGGSYDTGFAGRPVDDYQAAHPLAGARIQEDWGGLFIIGGYDPDAEAFGGKVRGDIVFNDVFKIFIMAGYQSDWNNDKGPGDTRRRNYYGPWNGDWAAWGGFTATVNEKTSVNGQVAYEQDGTLATALNMEYMIVDNFKVQPEFNYTKFDGERGHGDAVGGTIRFQRDF
ncbi:porin [Rhizobium sp. Leaf341]|uniref:porin n=1 Tax=Rhizobium sp. Leaf341 TaxID=1736344 RepID=UPI000714DF71|nr:porin [Rhizobium sp. Leaf341]KQR78001.1 porin [Rhizobium sp. Leaf341]